MLKRTLVAMLLTAAGFLVHSTARADVFRCTGAGGTTLFTDMPCPSGMRTTDTITSAQECRGAACGRGIERSDEALERRSAEREQLLNREEERRRVEQELAAREEALRRAEQEVAIREQESFRRAEEDARLRALWPPEDIVPAAPYAPPASYPVVVVPVWPCAGPRCFPVPHHPSHKPGHPPHHHPHTDPGGSHDGHASYPGGGGDNGHRDHRPPPRQDGRQFAKQ